MSHLTHLRTFIEAYRTGSLSRAAENLGITQPAATNHIQSLETLVGKPLFIRASRGVKGTVAADELARSISHLMDGLELKISSLRTTHSSGGVIYLAAPQDFICSTLEQTIEPLMAIGYQIRIQTGNKQKIYELLASNSVDLAITTSIPDEKRYGFAHLVTERLLLVYSPLLAAAIGTAPSSDSLKKVPLIAYDEDLPLVRTLWSERYQHSPDMQAALTVPDIRIIKKLVMKGHGWSVLSDIHVNHEIVSGALITPTKIENAPMNSLYLVWNRQMVSNNRIAKVKELILKNFPRHI